MMNEPEKILLSLMYEKVKVLESRQNCLHEIIAKHSKMLTDLTNALAKLK